MMMNTRTFAFLTLLAVLILPKIGFAAAIAVSSSYEEVIQALGKPDGDLSAGSKQILTYGKAQVVLRNKKVVSVSSDLENLLTERSATKSTVEQKRKAGLVSFRGSWMTPEEKSQLMKDESRKRATKIASRQPAGGWHTDFAQASAIAKSQNKKMLLNFTGSDWCGWCIKLDQEVFSKSDFIRYAQDNYVLVKLDFPKAKSQPKAVKKQNHALAKKYGVRGYPTIVVLKPSGKVHTKGGYVRGGPKAFLKSIR